MSPVFGTAGRVGQGPALPAHLLHELPAEAGGSSLPAALPRVSHPRPSPIGGGASCKPPAGADPAGASELHGAQQQIQIHRPLFRACGQGQPDSQGGPKAGESRQQ